MRSFMPFTIVVVAASLTHSAGAQSFNVDIGQAGTAPPSTYAGAGRAGHWLALPATQGVSVFNLADVNGITTSVYLSQIGGTETLTLSDPALLGDDATLMNDVLITHTTVENCIYFWQLLPGEYEVVIYARMPAQPAVFARTKVDQEPGVPVSIVGGAWTGQHELGVSYSRHLAVVAASGPQAGRLVAHAGVVSGGSFAIGAAMNAIQIRRIIAGDVNGDEQVNVADLLGVITAWGPCPVACAADLNHDGLVNVADLLIVITNWGA